jgi:hypothetical protein
MVTTIIASRSDALRPYEGAARLAFNDDRAFAKQRGGGYL